MLKKNGFMTKLLLVIFLVFSSCGKKGELFLEGKDAESIIQIDEERIYKF